jgi:hypothetical protein
MSKLMWMGMLIGMRVRAELILCSLANIQELSCEYGLRGGVAECTMEDGGLWDDMYTIRRSISFSIATV